jgi:hypothetical protein
MRLRTFVGLAVGVLALAAAPAAATEVNLFVGFDTGGSFDLGTIDLESESGYTLGLEVIVDLPVFDFGVGAEYGVPRSPTKGASELQYSCIYGIARVTVIGILYLTGRYGYADVDFDEVLAKQENAGRLWSLGAGVSLGSKWRAEALYTEIKAGFTYETYSARLIYTL